MGGNQHLEKFLRIRMDNPRQLGVIKGRIVGRVDAPKEMWIPQRKNDRHGDIRAEILYGLKPMEQHG
jgi:hypothetical protein